MEHDDVLAKIDATLEALFPPDDSLDERIVELVLQQEIDVDSEELDPYEDPPDPFGLYELHALYAEWIRRRGHRGAYLVYGVDEGDVVFVAKPVAYAIETALDRIEDEGRDWESVVPWVDQDQDDVLPHELVERYGTYGTSMVDGPCVGFRSADADAIVEGARRHGMHCERDDDLVRRVRGYA